MKMRTIGFPISHKENELRRALVVDDLLRIKNREAVYVETGYGDVLGMTDAEYQSCGVHVVSRKEVLQKDIICDPKIGDADYLDQLYGQTIFGWIHAVQNKIIADKIVTRKLTAFAWEDMYEEGRHVFWRNNEVAGEAAVFHAFMCHGVFPYGKKVAVLGRGNTARGAIKMLNHLGADVVNYDRRTEQLFREELSLYDVIVNAVLWDTRRHDHIIYESDISRMKRNSMIIDISCDRNGGIETSIPTTIENPTYMHMGIRHYVVDHTPALFWKTTSECISSEVIKYVDKLIENKQEENATLNNSLIIKNGIILDEKIRLFHNR